jgi:hypothetical protein
MIHRISNFVLSLLIIHIFFSCTQKSNWDKKLDWERLDLNSLPAAADYPDAGAVVLHDEARIETFGSEENGWSLYSRHRIVKIFDIRGHQYANVAIPYSPGNELEHLQARTISPDGKIIVVNANNIYDISLYPNYMLYSDQKSKLFTFPAIENGSIVEYKYTIQFEGHNYGNSWSFQDKIPVLYSRFEINIPADSDPKFKFSGIELEPQIIKTLDGDKTKYIWQAKNLPPIEPEIAMPVIKNSVARLRISSTNFKSWEKVADWYGNLSKTQMHVSDDLKNLVLSLTRNKVKDTEKLKVIYEWIVNNIRYISVSIGIGSYQPHLASEVLQNRYGDCKDMTTLLCTMAKEAGVDVFPGIISTWQNGEIDTTIVSVGQFNHVIAFYPIVGDSGIWLEPTDNASAFNSLPWYDQGRQVLVVMGDSSRFIRTPKTKYLSNRNYLNWNVDLRQDGSAVVTAENRIWGARANDLRFDLMIQSEKDRQQWIQKLIEEKSMFSTLDSTAISGENPIRDPLIIWYRFETDKFADRIHNDLIFCPGDVSAMNLSDVFDEEERKYPVKFKYGMQQQVNLEIHLPENWRLSTNKIDKKTESAFGEASWRWYVSGNILHVQNQFILKGDDIQPDEYPDFKSFLKEVRMQELQKVIVSGK